MPNYTYRAWWDVLHDEFVAECLEFPQEEGRGATAHEAIAAVEQAVDVQLAELTEFSMEPPESISDREAAEQGVSVNQWVVSKLSDRPIKFGINDLFD